MPDAGENCDTTTRHKTHSTELEVYYPWHPWFGLKVTTNRPFTRDVREPEKFPGFVSGVAKNRVIKRFQRASRQESLTETGETTLVPHATSDQLDELLQKGKAGIVRQILKEMTNEQDAQALFRFYLAEDDKERICADLGLTNLQFSLALRRARERYKELYERTMRDK
jgi:RNA polymerase sigma-70 factor, ECF subfamily